MSERVAVLWTMDEDAIGWQKCAICGEQRQRIIRETGRPDFAYCNQCQSAFVLEDGGNMRMLYGYISSQLPTTQQMIERRWLPYFEISAIAARERQAEDDDILPAELRVDPDQAIHGRYDTNMDAYLALEAENSQIFYDRVRKLEPPPRELRETGDLPNIDDLFQDQDPDTK